MRYKTDTNAIKKIMIDKGINTISELSEKANIHRNTLGKILKGKIQPSSDVMYKLVECLNMTPDQAGMIFFGSGLHIA